MTSLSLKDPRKLVAEHLAALRKYAKRVLVQGQSLNAAEDADRENRMREYLAIGSSFNLRAREMVAHLYKGLLIESARCDCTTCRNRRPSKG